MTRTTALAAALAAGLTSIAFTTGPGLARDMRDAGAAETQPVAKEKKTAGDEAAGAEKPAAGDRTQKNDKTAERNDGGTDAKSRKGRRHVAELETGPGKRKAPVLVATARKTEVLKGMTTVTETTVTTTGGGRYGEIVSRYATAYGIPASLAHAVIRVESNYRADARGRAGEVGLMQIKPATARGLGYSGSVKALYNPETNIRYGMKYLAQAHKLGGGTTCGTILKYNAGHGAKRMNPVSAAYCSKVKRHLGGS